MPAPHQGESKRGSRVYFTHRLILLTLVPLRKTTLGSHDLFPLDLIIEVGQPGDPGLLARFR